MNILITLDSNIGTDLGPFTLSANIGNVVPSTATRTELINGLQVTVDNSATQITITSDPNGLCSGSILTLNITGIPQDPCDCTFYNLTIGQEDIDDATGNTGINEQYNNLILVTYTNCDGVETVEEYGLAGFYENQLCVKSTIGGGVILTRWKDDQEGVVNAATSFATDTLVECCEGGGEPIV